MFTGAFVTEARARAELSVAQFAERLRVSADTVDAWELGRVELTLTGLQTIVLAAGFSSPWVSGSRS